MTDFSIIVPTFNRGELLRETLKTLKEIDYDNFEIIVVDDGSTDHTEEIVKPFLNNQIHYFKKENAERGAARNYGAKQAKGRYINFFDSDDWAYSDHLQLASKVLKSGSQPEAFALSYEIRNEPGKLLQTKILNGRVSEFIANGNDLSCNGIFIRKDIALEHPFSEKRALSASEDYELWLRLSARYPFHCYPLVSHAVVHHDMRSTLNFNPEPLIKRKLLMLELAEADTQVRNRFNITRLRYAAYSYIALHIALSGSKKGMALQWYMKSLRLRPMQFLSRRSAAIVKHLLLL